MLEELWYLSLQMGLYDSAKMLICRGANNWILDDMSLDHPNESARVVKFYILPPSQSIITEEDVKQSYRKQALRLPCTPQGTSAHGEFINYMRKIHAGGNKRDTVPILETILYESGGCQMEIWKSMIRHKATNWRLVTTERNQHILTVIIDVVSPNSHTNGIKARFFLDETNSTDMELWGYIQGKSSTVGRATDLPTPVRVGQDSPQCTQGV